MRRGDLLELGSDFTNSKLGVVRLPVQGVRTRHTARRVSPLCSRDRAGPLTFYRRWTILSMPDVVCSDVTSADLQGSTLALGALCALSAV